MGAARFNPFRTGWCAGLAALSLAAAALAQDPDTLFQRVKAHMLEHLSKLPNYTCHETIRRFMRRGTSWQHLDDLEMDVIYSGQKELFSSTGTGNFGEMPVEKLVSRGTIGNGALGSHIDLLLSQAEAEFKYAGTGKKDGRKALRFDLTVPLEKSHFSVRHNGAEGMAGYEGSLWVDADTYDPVRVDFRVNRIPSYIGVRLIEESLHYRKMTIGNTDFYLPEQSELAATDEEGVYTLNQMKLDRCREFTADSVVKYGTPTEGSAARQQPDHQ